MRIIGLTGSIGMGKSTLARQWRSIGVPVHDADKTVHTLMQPGGAAFDKVKKAFPSVIEDGQIDRKALGIIIFNDVSKRKILENIIHPLVRKQSHKFIQNCRRVHAPLCVLDIPLLFETGRDKDMDEIICITAPLWIQKRRVLCRPGMTEDKFNAIVKTQMPDYYKKSKSNYIVSSARGRRHTLNMIKTIKNNE